MKALEYLLVGCLFMTSTALGQQAAKSAIIQKASWTKLSFNIKGTAVLSDNDGEILLQLDDQFKTRNAPDLKLFLSPLKVAKVTGKNATKGSRLIAPLKKNKKAQAYALPADVRLSDYKSVLLHCEKYAKVWGGFDLVTKKND